MKLFATNFGWTPQQTRSVSADIMEELIVLLKTEYILKKPKSRN